MLIECKWRNKKASKKDIDNFLKKCSYIKDKRKLIAVFISKSGFEDNVFAGNGDLDIIKIDIKDIKRAIYLT